jgi:hypothetical protein
MSASDIRIPLRVEVEGDTMTVFEVVYTAHLNYLSQHMTQTDYDYISRCLSAGIPVKGIANLSDAEIESMIAAETWTRQAAIVYPIGRE